MRDFLIFSLTSPSSSCVPLDILRSSRFTGLNFFAPRSVAFFVSRPAGHFIVLSLVRTVAFTRSYLHSRGLRFLSQHHTHLDALLFSRRFTTGFATWFSLIIWFMGSDTSRSLSFLSLVPLVRSRYVYLVRSRAIVFSRRNSRPRTHRRSGRFALSNAQVCIYGTSWTTHRSRRACWFGRRHQVLTILLALWVFHNHSLLLRTFMRTALHLALVCWTPPPSPRLLFPLSCSGSWTSGLVAPSRDYKPPHSLSPGPLIH